MDIEGLQPRVCAGDRQRPDGWRSDKGDRLAAPDGAFGHAICDRIVVKGRSIVAARLTAAAYANGLALALPQVVMARPEGCERALPTVVVEGVANLVAALRAA